ncbi:MAG: AGE family epimerase/isomerase [Ancrocorticia sp.]|uniref:AGE family epimerase/isomerase n=1 Tax=Ancrocorticia sp. TaxID=2593684 RepID=UPI003F91F7A4
MSEHVIPLFEDSSHLSWLADHRRGLLDFAKAHVCSPEGGYAWLDAHGDPMPAEGHQLWIGSRMIHIFSLAAMAGQPGARDVVEHGLDFYVDGAGRDHEHGGWFAQVGGTSPSDAKELYGTAQLLLAASSATQAGFSRGRELLDATLHVIDTYYWDEEAGRAKESYDATFTQLDPYRGQNANMHLTEALLAAYEATGDPKLLARATSIATFVAGRAVLPATSEPTDELARIAATAPWRLPEHFDSEWTPIWDYNINEKRHAFRPYGSTVGHWLEWAKLCMQIHGLGIDEPWLVPTAESLFKHGITEGWTPTGGFYYTVDWDGSPVVSDKFFWAPPEAVSAAVLLYRETNDEFYAQWYNTIWEYCQQYFVPETLGAWQHELDGDNRPTSLTWDGRPDIYHVYQATLYPLLPEGEGVAAFAAKNGAAAR